MSMMKRVRSIGSEYWRSHNYREDKTAAAFVASHRCPALTREEKAEIDRYWAAYHVRFRDYDWHRMFYAVTGIHDPRYIPHPFAVEVLYRYYKKMSFSVAYADKNMFTTFQPQLKFPTAIGKRVNGRYYDAEGTYHGETVSDALAEKIYAAFLANSEGRIRDVILKVAVGSGFGKGVQKFAVSSREDIKRILTENDVKNLILQMAVQQHPFFARLNPDSVNIIRITTWRVDDQVYFFSPCIRFGIRGSHTDVAFRDGKEILNILKIDPSGRVSDRYVTLDGEHKDLPADADRTVPCWKEILETVRTGALHLDYFDIVAWDHGG